MGIFFRFNLALKKVFRFSRAVLLYKHNCLAISLVCLAKGTNECLQSLFKSGAFRVKKGIYLNIFLQVHFSCCKLPELVKDLMISNCLI